MPLRDLFRLRTPVQASLVGGVVDPSTLPVASPWSTSNLQRIVFEDIFGDDLPTNTRAAAMRLPAIARGRHLIVSSIARMPLVQLRKGEVLPAADVAQPSWINAAPGGQSPQHRLAWIVDDLIFYGWSCLWRRNGADGWPLELQRVAMGDWAINADGRVEVNGIEARDDEVVLVPGFHEGILTFGSGVLRDARTLQQIVTTRLNCPVPPIDLHQTQGVPLTNDERDDLIAVWTRARQTGSGVGYSSPNMEVKVLQSGDEQLMIEGRNAMSLDLARLVGISAGLIDATVAKASLNYETAAGRDQEFTNRDLQLYMEPIRARLSMDDVTPHGSRMAWDLRDWIGPVASPTGPQQED